MQTQTCTRRGCVNAVTMSCAYVDGTGARCGVTLCAEHSRVSPVCPRHTAVVAWLNGASATLRPQRPAVADRSASLLLGLAGGLEAPLVELLRSANADTPGVQAAADGLAELRRADGMAWEYAWAAYTSTGHLDHVALRAAGEPPLVRLLVNQHEVFSAIPYWIARRHSGAAPDSRDYGILMQRLLDAATEAIRSEHAAISWLPAS